MGSKKSQKSDEKIASLIQSGDIDLFGDLISRYKTKMTRYSRKFLSDKEDINDVVQDIFIKTYTNIQGFDIKRKFSSWLYRIAHNELVNRLKKNKRRIIFSLPDLDAILPHKLYDDNLRKSTDLKDTKKMIDKVLDKLESKYKEPIILYYLEWLSYKEISEVMKIPTSTVGIRIKRAKKIMRGLLKK